MFQVVRIVRHQWFFSQEIHWQYQIQGLLWFFLGSFLIIRFGLELTDSNVPGWDALTSALAIAGMWLMARKKIEHWIAWIIVDSISVPLYIYKGLPLTSFQFLIFTILAFWGYLTWNIKLRLKESQS